MELPTSQTSSHFPLEPVSADVLAGNEKRRRDAARLLGQCRTGCAEVDDHALLGGLERGCVVGVSAEDEDVGVLLALQAVAHSWLDGSVKRAMIVTPKSASWAAGALRDAIKAELLAATEGRDDDEAEREKSTRFLDAAMISCVFDVDGLWEALADLDPSPAKDEAEAAAGTPEAPASKAGPDEAPGSAILEVGDSEDEGESPLTPPPKEKVKTSVVRDVPDVIVVTHLSSLFGGLFAQREKSAAHSTLQMLSSYIRYLSRTLPSQPLIMLLNSTTTADETRSRDTGMQQHQQQQQQRTKGHLDPTLRSVFNPPPLDLPGYAPLPASRRNKPTFGLVFSQFLDLHLLCTRIVKTKEDAGIVYGGSTGADHGQVSFVTVVEVLLDEMGVWQGEMGARRSREQRWGAVEVRVGRIGDAFKHDEKTYKDIRVVAGFGGPRV